MNEVVKNLILNATTIFGPDPDKVLEFLEDQLTPDQYLDVKEFLTWSFKNKRTFGHKNLDKRMAEYKKAIA
jgi:hypothetical protein